MKKIRTKQDFISFLKDLRKDYIENCSTWENKDIESFLEAMAAWLEDMDGFYANQGLPVPEKPDWRVFADIFMGAKLYE
ncbi:DUF7660 family protein [Simkania negevensis]|uniref:DUF7660 domain-containing protein n=1 Tax=Simkania negevensis (strain ATCC VR-1471 / DSM 27360 / Z) TaxID=331113 RepID=F8L4J8_SIMNZ|nr:hypothetical protein [Simkania negevensis]CCB90253.1 putative uncharacterized protein [Simkania negevensis Z]